MSVARIWLHRILLLLAVTLAATVAIGGWRGNRADVAILAAIASIMAGHSFANSIWLRSFSQRGSAITQIMASKRLRDLAGILVLFVIAVVTMAWRGIGLARFPLLLLLGYVGLVLPKHLIFIVWRRHQDDPLGTSAQALMGANLAKASWTATGATAFACLLLFWAWRRGLLSSGEAVVTGVVVACAVGLTSGLVFSALISRRLLGS